MVSKIESRHRAVGNLQVPGVVRETVGILKAGTPRYFCGLWRWGRGLEGSVLEGRSQRKGSAT